MRCACGQAEAVPIRESIRPIKRLNDEIAYVHAQTRCGWDIECGDCHGYFPIRLDRFAVAKEVLLGHLFGSIDCPITVCAPNKVAAR